jgi:hypothetical protein
MTEWRKHDPHFLLNAKIVRATMQAGPVVPILALTLLDLNAIGDRRGTLGREESQPDFLELRLLSSGLREVTADDVARALDALAGVGFLELNGGRRIVLPGWSDDEFGIRGRGPKPKDLRACDHCGEAFRPQHRAHRFCSDDCRKRHHEEQSKAHPDESDATSDECLDDTPDAWSDGRDGEKEGEKDRRKEGRKGASVRPRPSDADDGSQGSFAPPETSDEGEESVEDLLDRYRSVFQAEGGAA